MAGVLAGAAIVAAAPGVIKAVGSMFGGGKRRKEQREAARELKGRKSDYESFQFKDPTADMTNPFEDLTVNQQQAQFQAQQSQQGLANTMSGMQGAAGGSGIAALAQAMAGQQSQNLQAASASIGAQESANQMKAAQGAQSLQTKKAEGAKYVQNKEFDRTSTLLGMAQERKGAADAARAKAKEDLVGGLADAAGSAGAVLTGGVGGGAGGAAGGVGGAMKSTGLGTTQMKDYGASFANKTKGMIPQVPNLSDRRLKKDIKLIGMSPSGLKIYSFEFKDTSFGKGKFQGVMSDEIPSYAVRKGNDGLDRVDYSKLDVEFKNIK